MVGMKKRVLKRGGGSAMKKRMKKGGDVDMIKKKKKIYVNKRMIIYLIRKIS